MNITQREWTALGVGCGTGALFTQILSQNNYIGALNFNLGIWTAIADVVLFFGASTITLSLPAIPIYLAVRWFLNRGVYAPD